MAARRHGLVAEQTSLTAWDGPRSVRERGPWHGVRRRAGGDQREPGAAGAGLRHGLPGRAQSEMPPRHSTFGSSRSICLNWLARTSAASPGLSGIGSWLRHCLQSAFIRRIKTLPATEAAHDALLALGFEGSVLKRRGSRYRAGRSKAWVKYKARYSTQAVVLDVRQDRNGHWHAICDASGRRVAAVAGASAVDQIGQVVRLVYSRVDADGGLREARLANVAGL